MAGPQIRIIEDKGQIDGGWAIIVIDRIGQYLGDGTIGIRRLGYDASHLSVSGWRVADARLPAERWELRDGALKLYVGPEVTEFLTSDDHVTIDVNGIPGQATMAWPVITPFYGGKAQNRRFSERPPAPPPPPPPPPPLEVTEEPTVFVPLPPPPPPPPPPHVEPVVEEETIRPERLVERPPVPPRHNFGWLVPALWCVLSLAIGAAAWANRGPMPEITVPGPTDTPPVSPALPDVPRQSPESSLPQRNPGQVAENPPPQTPSPSAPQGEPGVVDIVRQAQSAQEIYDWAQRFRSRGDFQGMLLLLENAAERGHGQAMFDIAQLYDPATFVPNRPFSKANPEQAAKFYRKAEAAGILEAKGALVTLKAALEKLAAEGDAQAKAALATYWPRG